MGNINNFNFYLKCVVFYSESELGNAKKNKLTAQLMLLIFPEETLASHFKPKKIRFDFFVM